MILNATAPDLLASDSCFMLDADRDNIDSIHPAANRASQHDDNNTAFGNGSPGLSDATGHVLHPL
jgi:hypothetical protein